MPGILPDPKKRTHWEDQMWWGSFVELVCFDFPFCIDRSEAEKTELLEMAMGM